MSDQKDRLEPLLLGPMDGREVDVPASEGRIVIRFDGQIVWPTALAEAYIEGDKYGRYDRDAEGRLVWAGWVE